MWVAIWVEVRFSAGFFHVRWNVCGTLAVFLPLGYDRIVTRPLLFALSLMATVLLWDLPSASADIYKCKDKNGGIHYSSSRHAGMRCSLSVKSKKRAKASTASKGRRRAAPPTKDRYTKFDAHIKEAAALYQLPEAIVRAVMRVESDFNPTVVSHAGAIGLMQLMPRTAASMGVRNPFDPRENILGGTRYLRILANMFNGDLVLTVAAYNAGEGAVLRHRGIPPYTETQRYVRRVLKHYYAFRSRYKAASN